MAGAGNSYTTEFRQLDPRLGRWFSPDPVFQPWQSPYTSMDNDPINLTDVMGDCAVCDASTEYIVEETTEEEVNQNFGKKNDDGVRYHILYDENDKVVFARKYTPAEQKQKQSSFKVDIVETDGKEINVAGARIPEDTRRACSRVARA